MAESTSFLYNVLLNSMIFEHRKAHKRIQIIGNSIVMPHEQYLFESIFTPPQSHFSTGHSPSTKDVGFNPMIISANFLASTSVKNNATAENDFDSTRPATSPITAIMVVGLGRDCGDRPQEKFIFDRIFETTCKISIFSRGSVPKSLPPVVGVGRHHAARPGP